MAGWHGWRSAEDSVDDEGRRDDEGGIFVQTWNSDIGLPKNVKLELCIVVTTRAL